MTEDMLRVYRIVREQDVAHDCSDVLGWCVEMPSGLCLIDWNQDAYPERHRLSNPHISQYGSLDDVEQVTSGNIEPLSARGVHR